MSRFTIRDLLWLTVIVAMTIGWWIDHRSQAKAKWQTEALVAKWRDRAEFLKSHIELIDDRSGTWSDTHGNIAIGGRVNVIVDP